MQFSASDLISSSIPENPDERQTLLELIDVEQRLRRFVQFLLAQVRRQRKIQAMNEELKKPDFVMNPGEKTQMLFVQMVFQLSGLATMLLGKAPHPDTGKTVRDLEAAQVMIDQLEMLESKTKGNLNREEEQLLRQTLMNLRIAYVEAVKKPAPNKDSAEASARLPETPPVKDSITASEEESKKRFTKKY